MLHLIAFLPLFLGDTATLQPRFPTQLELQNMPKTYRAKDVSHHMQRGDYLQAVDEAWGEGGDAAEDLRIFDLYWNTIHTQFACFQDLDVDWDEFRELYRDEVAQGVSRGRLAFIISRMAISLREAHSVAFDFNVFLTQVVRDTPVFRVLISGTTPFGAAVTSQPDGSGLVYRVDPDHPLGLQPGDLLLGYDGRPWSEIWPEMLDSGLPIYSNWGSAPQAFEHGMAASIGVNWHLFDELDVKRRDGAVVHLATSAMETYEGTLLFQNDQLAVGGLSPLTWEETMQGAPNVRWGFLEGTDIGYIYVFAWLGDVDQLFDQAITELTIDAESSGLIIDFRTNFGGNMFLSNDGLSKLFAGTTRTIGFAKRDPSQPDNRLAMVADSPPEAYNIVGGETGYENPIAVLVGPGAVSSGDQVAYRMTFHPRAKLFGMTTNGAFNAPADLFLGSDWLAQFAVADAYPFDNPSHYLTHDPLSVDVGVWLRPDDVAMDRDTVVEAALGWIRAENSSCEQPDGWLTHVTRSGGFFNSSFGATNASSETARVILQPYAIDGRELLPTALDLPAGGTLTASTASVFNDPDVSHISFCAPEGVAVSVGYRAASGNGATAWVGATQRASTQFTTYPAEWDFASDGIAVLNIGEQPTSIMLEMLDDAGTVTGQHLLAESLAPKAKALLVVNSVFEEPGSLMRVVADHDVQTLFLKITHVELGPTYLYEGQSVGGL